ncbi:Scr1 family TA system antitoxin-like transcriptional regulator [Streptomyces sp. DASNCL29]|uniref:Scr1 family TA system antitoxin-like transcriptional regulator n=1 Tax=Streptomyces sp. DASNCL29 TaxID=2583819 RepID=UPI00110FEB17|nr:Scr1 family TA system antitoxin-like transcriptional regulator [Streptomyces sp. DASNCL29]TMU90058.1 helix-turn-helix domain-containing protein [Streptomyces sp. DASNCL29]
MTTIPDRGPAALVLGACLRSLRLAKGIKAAKAIRGSEAKLSRMETGQVAQRWDDVSTLVRVYGMTDWSTIVDTLRWSGWQSRDPKRRASTIHDNAEGWMDRLRACEHHASAICVYASATIPRIVQTTGCPVDLLTLRTTATQPPRVSPHTVLPDQTRQDVTVILDGAMLLRTCANPAAMAAQMAYLQHLRESTHGPRILVVPFQAGVIPPHGTLHRFLLHDQEVFAEETWSAIYTTGADSQAARDCLAAGLTAAKDLKASAALLDIARRRFEQLAKDPESDPLLEELTA